MIEQQARLFLCRPNGEILYQLNGVHTDNVEYSVHVKDYNEISFTVDRYINVDGQPVESNGYEDICVNMYVLLEGKDMFQLQEPTIENDGIKECKNIKGYSREKEFEDKDWVGLKVNTGDEDSLEYLIDGNTDEFGFAKEYITLYKSNSSGKTEFSFLHYILEKMPGWTIDDEDIDAALWDRKFSISEDNINLYALLTSSIAPKLECLFLFDTVNKHIKAVSKESLDEWYRDTNIFISMRNLANNISVEVDEDSIFTVFNVRGADDIDVRTVNYNDSYVYDLSYFKSEPWMTTELAGKITTWETWRDDNRDAFIELTKDRAAKNAEIYNINYMVPNDADEWTQWDNMDTELLQKNFTLYQEQLKALRVIADEDPQYDEDGNYITHKTESGDVDEEYYESRLLANKSGYYTYIEIRDYIIPNITIALANKERTEDEKEDYVKDYETNWDLFGIIELQGKEESYENQIKTLDEYSKDWDELTDEEKLKYVTEDTYNIYHNQYVQLVEWLGSEIIPGSLRYHLAELRTQLHALEDEIEAIDDEITAQAEYAAIENEAWGLTEDELITFRTLCHHTDYTNENILTTSIDTTLTTVDVEKELYDDAVSKLSEVSRPQYSFSVDLDNLLNIPEFEEWIDDFELLNFMRLGIRDDYSVKLRLTGYTTNPCEIDPLLTLEFSSYITSKSGRSDLTALLDTENNRGSKNSISIGTGSSKDDKEYLTNLMYMISKSGMFTSAVSGIATGIITTGSVSAGYAYATSAEFDQAKVNELIANYVNAGNITADKIVGREAEFETLSATYIDSEYIVTNIIDADQAIFQQLTAEIIDAAEISADKITSGTIDTDRINVADVLTVGKDQITTIANGVISTAQINADQITSGTIDTDRINVNDVLTVGTDKITEIANGVVTTESVIAKLVDADQGDFDTLTADSAFMKYLQANLVVASEIQVDDLKAKLAQIDTLEADSAFVNYLQSISSTTATSVINDAYIYNAVAGKIAVGDLAAGNIVLTDTMQILSENGMLAMNGTTMQIGRTTEEEDGSSTFTGIQIGYDASDNASIIITDENGTAIMTSQGITANAVSDGLIVNNMISDSTISKEKLGFTIIEPNEQGGIDITQVYDGSGNNFGVEYTSFKNNTEENLDNLADQIEDSATYSIYIEAPSGTNIRGSNITLNARLFKNSTEVTSDYDDTHFIWTRHSQDADGDTYWNESHSAGTKSLTITANEVTISADFQCVFSADGITVSS